jgi:pSer/pThr/pTyr-binding forkhead associated (FHA) protein
MDGVMWLSLLGIGVVIALGYWLARSRAASGPHITFAPSSTPSGESATRSVTGPAPRRNVLVGIDGDVNGKTFHIGMRTVTMGRSSSNFVQTLDEKASRTHCQFKPSLEGLFVRDMNSRNGMRVNGTPITAEELLEDGDEIRVGEACFRYHRRLTVARDASMDRKNVSLNASRTTQKAGLDNLTKLLDATLRECDGDVERTAEELGCDVATVETLLNVHRVTSGKTEMAATQDES